MAAGPFDSVYGGRVVHSARLMFCPQCKAEYRSGFRQCSDCYVDLVEWLPEKQSSSEEKQSFSEEERSFSNEGLTLLWECADETECVGVCRDLQKADIPYKVDQIPFERTERMRVKWHYRILISPCDFDRAKELLSIDGPQHTIPSDDDADDQEVFDPSLELPDTSASSMDEPKRRDTYLDPWYPEDATIEVWRQEGDDLSSGIQHALDANRIHCRCDSDARSGKKIFVRPEDESFAREIVREIVEGTPLK
jgi:hypothetical protein